MSQTSKYSKEQLIPEILSGHTYVPIGTQVRLIYGMSHKDIQAAKLLKYQFKPYPPSNITLNYDSLPKHLHGRWAMVISKPNQADWVTIITYTSKSTHYGVQRQWPNGSWAIIPSSLCIKEPEPPKKKSKHCSLNRIQAISKGYGTAIKPYGFLDCTQYCPDCGWPVSKHIIESSEDINNCIIS